MAEEIRREDRKAHKYQPDPACEHNRQRPPLMPGWAWVTDKDGDRVMGRCECWKRWQGQYVAEDRKVVAAGRD